VVAPVVEAVPAPLVLDPVAHAVAASRRYVRRRLTDLGAGHLVDSAELGVSELVTNAILHGREPLTVTVEPQPDGRVRVSVRDSSPLQPQHRRLSPTATTGRGLRLVAAVSTAWGVDPVPDGTGPGKTIWFEPCEEPSPEAFLSAWEDLADA
jgi:anti-sigma regulatory factor (Ser/Thr protein kinase)